MEVTEKGFFGTIIKPGNVVARCGEVQLQMEASYKLTTTAEIPHPRKNHESRAGQTQKRGIWVH